eukprot:4437983-Pyramimonas_sp.AAC.2
MADPFDFDGSDDAVLFEDLKPSTRKDDAGRQRMSLVLPPSSKPPRKARRVNREDKARPAPVSRNVYDCNKPPLPTQSIADSAHPPLRSESAFASNYKQQHSSSQQCYNPGPALTWVEDEGRLAHASSAPPDVPSYSRRPMSPELVTASKSRREAETTCSSVSFGSEAMELSHTMEVAAVTVRNQSSHDVSLMETGEIGEEVAVVDEVMFALQGFASTQKTPVRQCSAAALIELCSNKRKRVILRQQGWAHKLVGTLLSRREDEPLLAKASALLVCLLVANGEGAMLFQEYNQVTHLTHLLATPPPAPPREGAGGKQAAKAFFKLQGACDACLNDNALPSIAGAPAEATDSATSLTL